MSRRWHPLLTTSLLGCVLLGLAGCTADTELPPTPSAEPSRSATPPATTSPWEITTEAGGDILVARNDDGRLRVGALMTAECRVIPGKIEVVDSKTISISPSDICVDASTTFTAESPAGVDFTRPVTVLSQGVPIGLIDPKPESG